MGHITITVTLKTYYVVFQAFHISRFILGSIPVENSSMSTTDGFPVSAIASESFLLSVAASFKTPFAVYY